MRIGMVGTNFISDMFMKAASPIPEIQVTAVTSGHREHAEQFAAKYQIPSIFDSLGDLIASDSCDMVYLAIPNSLHAEMAGQCIEAGMPVFVEKPIATNARQAEELFRLAEARQVYVHDGIVPLYTENFRILKESLGGIGRIRRAVFAFGKRSSRYDAYLAGQNPTTFRKELSNGSLMDLGVYCLADAVALFGVPQEIRAHAVKLDTGVDGAAEAVLCYPGFDAVIMTSKISDTLVTSEIEGEDGNLLIEAPSLISKVWQVQHGEEERKLISRDTDNAFGFQLQDLLADFVAGRQESAAVPHALSIDIMRVLDACREACGIVYPQDRGGNQE